MSLTLHVILLLALSWHQTPQQPEDQAKRFNRAVELQRQGSLKEAAAEYRAIIASSPNYVEALANLGSVLSRLGEYEECVETYERALKLAPNLMPLLLNLGIAHHRARYFDRAADAFEKVLAKAPDTVQARQLLGVSLVELGRDSDAVAHLESVVASSPQDRAVLYSLGLAYLRLGRPEVRDMVKMLESFPAGVPASHLLEGQGLLAGHEYERAVTELREALRLGPGLPRLHYSLGLALLKLGLNKDAIASFESELTRTPGDFSTLYYLAYLHEADGDNEAALTRLSAALKIEQESPEANALLGKILVKQNKPGEALAPLERAVKGSPNDSEKRYLLARVYQQLGRREDAAREFAEVQRLKSEQLKGDRARTPKPN